MKEYILTFVVVAILLGAVTTAYYTRESDPSPNRATEEEITDALLHTVVSLPEITPESISLNNGAGTFSLAADSNGVGTVALLDMHRAAFNEASAQVYALVNVDPGGSGVFTYLVGFAYSDTTHALTQENAILIGDRIAVDALELVQAEVGAHDVLVSIRDRLPNEAMATVPHRAVTFHFTYREGILEPTSFIFGPVENPDVVITEPFFGTAVSAGNLLVQGAARGNWYFEASFPVSITRLDGSSVADSHAEALTDWMTEALVPFEAQLTIPPGTSGVHILLMRNDNPSGDPERDKSVAIPIVVQ